MKKIRIIHPLKHHIYNSIYGITKLQGDNTDIKAFLGMYDNSIFIKKMLSTLNQRDKLNGYCKKEINKNIKTDIYVKILFLLSKFNSKYDIKYNKVFEKKAKSYVKEGDIIHVMQDYCNNTIRYAKDNNKIVVYEQIIAFDTVVKEYLEEEVKKWGFSQEYIEKSYDENKVRLAIENIRIVDYIISPSKFVTDSIISGCGINIKDKIIQIPYGVNINKFKYEEKLYKNERINLLCISRVTLTKGTQYMIEAMKKIKNKNVHLTYIGMPDNEEDNKLVNEMKKLDNITYIPNVPHFKIDQYYKQCDIFVLPSLIEGSALVIYEALASGLPCIVTENTGSVITNGKEGFIIKPQHTEQIVDKIKYCFNNRDALKKMSILARKTSENYTWENYSDNIRIAYENIIGR